MAEDVEIDLARMSTWTEDRARHFFENGGEDENEVTAWLREIDMLRIESAVRLHFSTLDILKSRIAESIGEDSHSTVAVNVGVDKVIASCKMNAALDPAKRLYLRNSLKALCGLGEGPLASTGGYGATAAAGAAAKPSSAEPSAAARAHQLPGAMPLLRGKKVILVEFADEPSLVGKVAEIMVGEGMPSIDDPASGGRYTVKLMHGAAGHGVTGRAQNTEQTLRQVLPSQIVLHPDQVEKDRHERLENAVVLLGGDEAEREARERLYEMRLDPQHWYDKAVDRILNARHEFDVLMLPPKWCGSDLTVIKKAYRRTSASVHPDKNSHPQAVDAFRKVYGAFETLLDLKQQWRLLFVLGKLQGDEATLFELEAEEEERFEWWWQANIPQIERQAAEAEGGELEAIGEQWISDGKGGNVDEVAWIGPAVAMRMCEEGSAIFLDCRERWEYDIEHIQGAHSVPMREFVDFGLQGVAGPWISAVIQTKNQTPLVPIIIYSEVATPFSRCRALSRWLLRAGHSGTISAARLRRLRGGIFGWRHKRGPAQLALTYVSPEERAKNKAAEFTNVANLNPKTAIGFNLRVRVQKPGTAPILLVEAEAGRPSVLLCDSSARVLCLLPTDPRHAANRALLTGAARAEKSVIVRGLAVVMREKTLLVSLTSEGTVTNLDGGMAIGFMAPLLSEHIFEEEEEEDDGGRLEERMDGDGPPAPAQAEIS